MSDEDGNLLNIGNKIRISRIVSISLPLILSAQFLFLDTSFAARKLNIKVFAASSLTAELSEFATLYERSHQNTSLSISFGGSSSLATQIKNGAPADIFISASLKDMQSALEGRNIKVTPFLSNHIVLAVPKSSKISKISDLTSEVIWIQCAHEVPCGDATDRGLAVDTINSKPKSLEPSVASTVAKLLAGSVDAAFIYNTDVMANSDKLRAIQFSDSSHTKVTYYIATLNNSSAIRNLSNHLLSLPYRRILNKAGFGSS